MANLWKRWWFRALIGVVATPVLVCAGAFPMVIVFGFLFDGYVEWSVMPDMLPAVAIAAVPVTILPWIAMEIGNRRRKRPLSARLTAGWLALSSAYLTSVIALSVQTGRWFPQAHLGVLMEKIGTGLPIALVMYVAPFILAWLTLRPLVVRWTAAAGLADSASVF